VDGDIRFTAFTSTYLYAGIETLGHLQSEVKNSPFLCSESLDNTESFSGPLTCGSGSENIGYEIELTFFVTSETVGVWAFRLGPDFGWGGAMFIDGSEVAQSVEDLWWNYSWDNSSELLEGGGELEEGTHTMTAIGFEGCCSGGSALQYRLSDSDWATLTPEGLGLNCEP
jgi:hypothetical protein